MHAQAHFLDSLSDLNVEKPTLEQHMKTVTHSKSPVRHIFTIKPLVFVLLFFFDAWINFLLVHKMSSLQCFV